MTRVALPLCLCACLICGCQSQESADKTSGKDPISHSQGLDLEAEFLIGPAAAREIGYRIDWEADIQPILDSGLSNITRHDDAVFVLDGRNYFSRLRRSDGRRLWRIPVADPATDVLGCVYVPALERIYLTDGGSVLVLDAESGSAVARQRLEKAANTPPARFGEHLIYGTRDGQVIWHSHIVEYQWKAYQVAESILITPVIWRDMIVAVGNNDASRSSKVMVLEADSASQRWSKPLLDEVVAAPAVANGVIYIAGTDQYLYAFDLMSGRTLWNRLTTAPLVDPPVVIGPNLYQQIPGEGLTCFDALPLDAPDGKVLWRCPDATGTVITMHRDRLLVWDAERRELVIVSAGRGGVISRLSLPDVSHLMTTGNEAGHLLAASDDGRVQRLAPR